MHRVGFTAVSFSINGTGGHLVDQRGHSIVTSSLAEVISSSIAQFTVFYTISKLQMRHECSKFEVSSFTRARDAKGGLNVTRVSHFGD